MAELEADVRLLQGALERQQAQLREADREKTRAVSELSEQNHRLLEQLSRVSTRGWPVFAAAGQVITTGFFCAQRRCQVGVHELRMD